MRQVRKVGAVAILNVTLGVLALACIALARDRLAAAWSVGFAGAGLVVWGAVQAWAAREGRLRGTKLLAMFMAILGFVIAGSSWLIQEGGAYRAATVTLGLLVVLVGIVDAVVAPDEERRGRFEPRRPQDRALR